MNQAPDKQTASGSVDTFAAELRAITGTYPPTAKQIENFQAELAERDFHRLKRQVEAKPRRLAVLTERAKRILRGDVDDE
jgi:hypothetical protein